MALICENADGPGRFSTRAQIVALSCACAGASAFLFAVDPSRHAVYPQCLLYRTTGLYCAGCGATRALYALLHGRFWEASHDNVLLVAALPLLMVWAGFYFGGAWRRNAWPDWEAKPAAVLWRGGAVFAVMTVFMIARNLPGWPFELLRPVG
jgi:hypothetical protein